MAAEHRKNKATLHASPPTGASPHLARVPTGSSPQPLASSVDRQAGRGQGEKTGATVWDTGRRFNAEG
jgi:hypothetical protein